MSRAQAFEVQQLVHPGKAPSCAAVTGRGRPPPDTWTGDLGLSPRTKSHLAGCAHDVVREVNPLCLSQCGRNRYGDNVRRLEGHHVTPSSFFDNAHDVAAESRGEQAIVAGVRPG